jgi:hypothetical protein
MKNSKLILINNLLFFFILFFNFDVNSQTQGFELQYGTGGWYEKNKKELPEIENQIYWNNNIKIGYKILPFISFGLSTNYNFNKYYSKSNHILLPDKTLFEELIIKNNNIGLGPYIKFSFGISFKLSVTLDYNYSFGEFNTFYIIDQQTYIEKHHYDIKHNLKYIDFEIAIGKKISKKLYLNLFVNNSLIFFDKYLSQPLTIADPYYQNYIGINLNYIITFKKIK